MRAARVLSPKLLISYLDLGYLVACILSPHFPNSLGMAPQTSPVGLGCAVVMSRVYAVEYVAAKSRNEQKVEKRGERSNLKLRRFCLTVSLKSK